MNDRTSRTLFTAALALLAFSAAAEDAPNWSADSWRTAPISEKAVTLEPQATDVGDMMPMMEIALVSRVCANPEFRTQVGKSPNDCARMLHKIKQSCTKEFQNKFPRADDAEIDGRMSFQRFSEGYVQCLKDRYTESIAVDGR